MNVACLLTLLATASILKVSASDPVGDPFVDEEKQSQGWREYPGAIAAGWQLALRLPTNEFAFGKPIQAKVVYHNVSTNQLRLYVATPGLRYMFTTHVVDRMKQELPMTDKAREQIEDGQLSLSKYRAVPPGTRLAFPVQLDELYAFKPAKFYDIHVKARGPLVDDLSLGTGVARIRIGPDHTLPGQTETTNRFNPFDQN